MSKSYISPELRHHIFHHSLYRCGYCHTSQLVIGPYLEIDHIIPEARGGAPDETNLAVACPMCNGRKGDRITAPDPETQMLEPLFHPNTDYWPDHFAWAEEGVVIRGITAKGRATAAVLEMNHPDLVAARRLWVSVGWHPPQE
jgi:hypothetical protein